MKRLVVVVVLVLAGALWGATPALGQSAPAPPTDAGSLRADFNNDGFADLAVGTPGEDVGTVSGAGAVNVLYGAAGGLTGVGSQLFTQDSPGVGSSAEPFDAFGFALAAGDFNRDGFADLAVGVPGEDVGAIVLAGAVTVLYGSAAKLTGVGSQLFTQDSPGVGSSAEPGDAFGSALAAGDFNSDTFDDLAVGVPHEAVQTEGDGAVNVLPGSAGKLRGVGSQLFTQNSPGVPDTAEASDFFGSHLAAGDFNQDGFADLAVGVSNEDIGAVVAGGAVNVLPGSAGLLTGVGSRLFTQNSAGVAGAVEEGDQFGLALAAGDFNRDGFADLAVGVPGEGVSGIVVAGAVNVLYGAAGGLTGVGGQLFTQDSLGVGSSAEPFDAFGWTLAAGDFDNDSFADLVVGVPFEDVGAIVDGGAVTVLYGSAAKLRGVGSQLFTQNSPGVGSSAEPGDQFSLALATGDFDSDTFADLAVGTPGEDVGTVSGAGAVNVLYGAAGGLTGVGSRLFTQDSPGVGSAAERGDLFGWALAASGPQGATAPPASPASRSGGRRSVPRR
jgi:FG-GAP repeat